MKNSKKQLRQPYISQFFHKNKTAFALAVFAALLMGVINLALSILLKELIDTIAGTPDAKPLGTLALAAASLVGAVLAAKGLECVFRPIFLKKAMLQYRNYVFGKLTKKNIGAFQKEMGTTYLSALTNDAASIEANYLELLFELVVDGVLFFGAFGLMLWYSPMLTLAAVFFAILPMAVSMLAGGRIKEAEERVSERNAGFTGMVQDALGGFSVIKGFRAEQELCKLFAKANGELEGAKCHRRRLAAAVGGIGAAAGAASQLGVFLAGAYLALHTGAVTAGVVMAFTNLMNFVIAPIAEMPGLLANRSAAVTLIDRLAGALERNVCDEGKEIPGELKAGIELRELSFAYGGGEEVLRRVSFSFEAGKSYAVVGASGSGKSTLLHLLTAAHPEYSGSIAYDGTELREISSHSLFGLVSLIQQNVFVFRASIRDNITMFQDFEEAEMERALRLSGLSDVLKKRGADYVCGENGNGLSGGEKQRIAIARSLLRRTPVLLADEATAALDAQTAYQVSAAILGLEGLTRIVVTHSMEKALLERYDKIVTIRGGQIAEQGTFRELMEKRGYFYSLYTVSQTGR